MRVKRLADETWILWEGNRIDGRVEMEFCRAGHDIFFIVPSVTQYSEHTRHKTEFTEWLIEREYQILDSGIGVIPNDDKREGVVPLVGAKAEEIWRQSISWTLRNCEPKYCLKGSDFITNKRRKETSMIIKVESGFQAHWGVKNK